MPTIDPYEAAIHAVDAPNSLIIDSEVSIDNDVASPLGGATFDRSRSTTPRPLPSQFHSLVTAPRQPKDGLVKALSNVSVFAFERTYLGAQH